MVNLGFKLGEEKFKVERWAFKSRYVWINSRNSDVGEYKPYKHTQDL